MILMNAICLLDLSPHEYGAQLRHEPSYSFLDDVFAQSATHVPYSFCSQLWATSSIIHLGRIPGATPKALLFEQSSRDIIIFY
jgi:hypothetical protein